MLNIKKQPFQFKGYTINFINGEYRAECYGEISFYSTNVCDLKKAITGYLIANYRPSYPKFI
jgi:hypothetical protein